VIVSGRKRKPCGVCGIVAYGDDRTANGYHAACGIRKAEDAIEQLHNKCGPVYEKRIRNAQIARERRQKERQTEQ